MLLRRQRLICEDKMAAVEYREVVLTEDLAPLLQRVLDKRQRVYDEENSSCEGRQLIGPVAALSEESKVPERRIYSILKGETAAVDLDVADRLLLACGMFVELELPEAIHPADVVREATMEQAAMIPAWAKARGIPIPPHGTSARRSFGGVARRIAKKERTAA